MLQPRMVWGGLVKVRLPQTLRKIVLRSLRNAPLVVRAGMPLEHALLDHVAVALGSQRQLRECFDSLVSIGSLVIEPPRLWPAAHGCGKVHWRDRKWMGTVTLREGLQLTLVASKTDGDVIAEFLGSARRTSELHHVAFLVNNIRSSLEHLNVAVPTIRQVSVVADDEPMSQVFTKTDPDHRLVELVERRHGFTGSFTCSNVQKLTQGERERAFADTSMVTNGK